MATIVLFISTTILIIVNANENTSHEENFLSTHQNDINKNINSRESLNNILERIIPMLRILESDGTGKNESLILDRYRDINTSPVLNRNYYKDADVEDRVKRQLPGLEGNQMMMGTFQAIMRPLGNRKRLKVQNITGIGNVYNETIIEPLSLILRMSRLLGMAPLTFASDDIRLSKAYYIYSLILIAALKTAILLGYVEEVSRPERSLRARTASARIMWLAYQTVLTAVTVTGCCGAPARCRSALDALRRTDEIRARVRGENKNSANMIFYIYATIFSFLSALIILCVVDFTQNLKAAQLLNKQVETTSLFSLFYMEYVIELLLEFQFMVVVLRLTLALRDVNEKLLTLLQAADINKFKIVRKAINNYVLPTKTTPIIYVEDSGKNNCVVREEACSETIRELALAYELVCDVVRCVDRGHGLLLLLLLQSCFLHFIMTPYYMINLYRVPDDFASIGQQIAWFHFYAANVLLLVEPCHRLQGEMEKTRSLVSRLLSRSRPRGALAQELATFFKILTLDQPAISPLGMYVLERPLVITILGVVSAYLVPRHYFTVPYGDVVASSTSALLLGNLTM